jgi:hypothetical protein
VPMSTTRFNELLVEFYQGAYGPTLRLETSALEDLGALRDLLRRVSARDQVDLLSIPGVASATVESCVLRATPNVRGPRVRTTGSSGPRHSFAWSQTTDGWFESSELVQGLMDHGRSGHQYLTSETRDDVLVELTFQE